MNVKSFFDLPEELEVVSSDVVEKVITLTAVRNADCPLLPTLWDKLLPSP